MSFPGTYIWRPLGYRVAVHIRKSVLAELRAQASAGSGDAVLVGRKGVSNAEPVLVIEAFHRIVGDVASEVAHLRRHGKVAIGFSRSEGDSEPQPVQLSVADGQLLASQLGETSGVFLVVRQSARFVGDLFFWHDGRSIGEPIPVSVVRTESRRRLIPIFAVSAAIVIILIVILWSSHGSLGKASDSSSSLGLSAHRDGAEALLNWNPKAAASHANEGGVVVYDGPIQREFQITPEQLRSGSFAYTPSSSDVTFALRVGDLRESIVAVGPRLAEPVLKAAPPLLETKTVAARASKSKRVHSAAVAPELQSRSHHPVLRAPIRFTKWLFR